MKLGAFILGGIQAKSCVDSKAGFLSNSSDGKRGSFGIFEKLPEDCSFEIEAEKDCSIQWRFNPDFMAKRDDASEKFCEEHGVLLQWGEKTSDNFCDLYQNEAKANKYLDWRNTGTNVLNASHKSDGNVWEIEWRCKGIHYIKLYIHIKLLYIIIIYFFITKYSNL